MSFILRLLDIHIVVKHICGLFFSIAVILGGVFQRRENWFIDYYYRGRRYRRKVGLSKGAAIQALSVREAEIAQGKFKLIPKRGALTFGSLTEKYLSLVSVHKRGHHVEQYIVKTLNNFFGRSRVYNLTAEDAEKCKAMRSKSAKPGTINREVMLAKHILVKGVEWKVIVENPFRGVRNLEVLKHVERVLTANEEMKLLAACNRVRASHLRPILVLALNTGMRRGEMLSLEWSRVDLNQRPIRLINTKSETGDRVIPMNAAVHSMLTKLAKTATSPLVFPSNRKLGEKFLDMKKGFHKAVTLARIPHITFHDLRHTFATRLVRAGVDIVTVHQLLGHSKITMTARYAHSLADAKIAAVTKLDLAGFYSAPDSNRTLSPSGVDAKSEVNSFAAST